jgi:hypothetical protein
MLTEVPSLYRRDPVLGLNQCERLIQYAINLIVTEGGTWKAKHIEMHFCLLYLIIQGSHIAREECCFD